MRNFARRVKPETLFLFVALLVANGANYGFHLLMTRLLGPADYGALGALLGILMVLAVPVGAVQAVVAGRIADQGPGSSGLVLAPALRAIGKLAAAGAVVVALTAPAVSAALGLPVGATIVLAAVLVPAFCAPAARGALQGARRFGALGAGIAASTVTRLTLGAIFAHAGMGITGAMVATLVAEVVGLIAAVAPFRKQLLAALGAPSSGVKPLRGSLKAGGALLALWLLVTADVVLARAYLPPVEAGLYAAGALIGRAVLFVPGVLAVMLLPSFVETRGSKRGSNLVLGAILAAAGCGIGASLATLFLPQAVGLLLGDSYADSRGVAAVLALGMGAFGATTVLLYHRIALGRSTPSRLWAALVAETAAIALFGRDAMTIAVIVVAAGVLTTLSLLPGALHVRRPRQRPVGELWRDPDADVDLSVVLPTYNGERVIGPVLSSLVETLRAAGIRHEVIVVSDGSTDGTATAARAFDNESVSVMHYENNHGKGFALRTGLARATGRMIAFIDADGDLDPISLVRFLSLMDMYDADMVIGSKRHPLSDIEYPPARRVMSWTYHKLVRILFGLRVRDTQTGVKVIRRHVLADVLPRLEEKRFAFDLELLAAARRAGYRRVLEAPVVLKFQFDSTVSWRSVVGILRDTAVIWARCYVGRRYDVAPQAQTPVLPIPPVAPDPVVVSA